MVTTTTDKSSEPQSSHSAAGDGISRDQVLADIRSGRRLEKIVASIRNFLEIQVSRVEETIEQCEAAVENDIRIQERLAEFEKEKRAWDETRKLEIARLSAAGDELSKAWEKLESDRRQFLDSKSSKKKS
jgi:hypothetical protein